MAYHAVVCREQAVQCHSLDTREDLVNLLCQLRRDNPAGQRLQVFLFNGSRLFTTALPTPFLLEAGSEPIPLFAVGRLAEASASGDLCDFEEEPADLGYREITRAGLRDAAAVKRESEH